MEIKFFKDIDFEKCKKEYGLDEEKALNIYKKMVEIRKFEEKVEELFLVKGILSGPSHLYLGQEAVATGVLSALRREDLMVTTYRCHGHALAKGIDMKLVMAELFGKATGTCKGLGGSMHASIYPELGSIYATAIVGSGIPIAVGLAYSLKYQGKDNLVVCFFGDGAVNTGAFHEGMNLASLWKVPLLLVCENNFYAMSTRVDKAVSSSSIAQRALSYNMETLVVDGNDVLSVYAATKVAEEFIRRGDGPFFLECRTYRMKGHGVYDKAEYRPKEEVEEWLRRDPIKLYKEKLPFKGEDLEKIEEEVKREVEEAVDFALRSPVLDFDELQNYVYK